jgi:hypothetical protein
MIQQSSKYFVVIVRILQIPELVRSQTLIIHILSETSSFCKLDGVHIRINRPSAVVAIHQLINKTVMHSQHGYIERIFVNGYFLTL